MTLQQLRYFLAACRSGSFTAAAKAMSISQPALSEQIKQLERILGAQLFIRAGRRLAITPAGRELVPHAERAVTAAELAAVSVKAVRGIESGTASLGTFGIAKYYFVQEVIAEFAARHPGVTVRVVGQNSLEVLELIRAGELEAGLITLPSDTDGMDVHPVITDEVLFCATEGDAVSRPMSIERLAEAELILYDAHFGWRDSTRRQLAARATEAGVELTMRIEVESLESALALAAQGLGGTFVSATAALSALGPANLRTVPFDPPLHDTFAFVKRKNARLSPATTELIRLAQRQIQKFGGEQTQPPETPIFGD